MIWDFLKEQILGMKWLKELIGSLLSALGLDVTQRVGGSICIIGIIIVGYFFNAIQFMLV